MSSCKALTKEYAFVQAFFWMSYCTSNGFAAVFLQGLGYTNTQLGMIIAGGCLLGSVSGPFLSSVIDRKVNRKVSDFMLPAILLQGVLLVILLLFPVKGIVSAAAYGLFIALSPVINSLNLKLYSDAVYNGRRIDYGFTRGIGSFAYVIITVCLGPAVKKFGIRMVPIMGLLILLGICCSFLRMNREVGRAGEKSDTAAEVPGRMQNESTDGSTMAEFIRENPRFLIFLIGAALMFYVHGNINCFLINIVRNVGGDEGTMGMIDGLIAAVEIPVMVFYTKLFRKTDSAVLIRIAFVCFILKSAAMAVSATVPQLAAACLLQAPSFALYTAAIVPYVAETIDHKDSAKAQSLAYVMTTTGGVLASLIAGHFYDIFSVPATLFISCGVGAVGTLIAMIGLKNGKTARK